MARIAVVGHVEWVDFLSVSELPQLGQITPARRIRRNAAGGAVVAATVLSRLGAEVDFFGAVGDDALGERAVRELEAHGIAVHMARRAEPTREVTTFLDAGGERSIVVIGPRLAPAGGDDLGWARLAEADGVYVTAADRAALVAARAARTLVATPRLAETLGEIDVPLDALVLSADDAREREWAARLAGRAALEVLTRGEAGGTWTGASEGSWGPVAVPGPIVDAYGAGDSFAAGFTYGLTCFGDPARAARIGAECGARALTHPGGP